MLENKGVGSKLISNVILNSREKLSINGVKEIISFDENYVSLRTVCGDLTIDGENIHINILNTEKGEVEMTGKIGSLNYYDSHNGEKTSLISKIFR